MGALEVAASAAGVVGVVGAGLVGVVRASRPLRRKLHTMTDDWAGDPARPEDGYPGRPGLMLRLATVEETVAMLAGEVQPNHGGSLRDAVDRIETALRDHCGQPADQAHPGGG